MWKQLQERQAILKFELNKRAKGLRKQEELEKQLENAIQRKQRYIKELKSEQKDVDNLDRFSFLNMIRTWTGKLDEIREKELSELAAVEAKFREVEKMVNDLEKDVSNNEKELLKEDWLNLERNWEQLIIEKEQWLFQNNEESAAKLEKLYEEKSLIATYIREVDEALRAGNNAKTALESALTMLDSAKGYSTWDTFFGGGLIATAVKHSKLNDSEDAIHAAQLELQRFQTELLDVQQIDVGTLVVERDSFVTFADYVFDDIFSAWTTHSKIHSSLERVERTISELNRICNQLIVIQNESKQKQQKIESTINEILEW
ncbi:hypothetical protein [Psychrobacillus vulpis]|uniref:Uncharacterized protein n=1 Tax=Psychrobacillus vulpis TaxID=2325572 RepID=A0A544TSC2_9BACI|nr:hypothetical protein [Psychrobacillus vulpis]TQR20310.1 hypothetical protein FG384_07660 [Psychrobacillus vulpis]